MVELKSRREIDMMASAGRILAEAMHSIRDLVRAGVHTSELDAAARRQIEKNGGKPAFLGYAPAGVPFPASICASVNEEVVHGIPGSRVLADGDIVSIDLGVELNGYFADAAYTFCVGKVRSEISRFLKISENALYRGIDRFVSGNRLYDISETIQRYVEENGYSVVRDLVGHGIGRKLHESPEVPNFVPAGKTRGIRLREGMVLAIEPMINMGKSDVEVASDRWTVVTKDRKLSAHFEHTVALTADGPEILTRFN